MALNVLKRGRVTYYYGGDHPPFSGMVTEDLGNGDLKIRFAGLTGGGSAQEWVREMVVGNTDLVTMEPKHEVEMVFRMWEKGLQDAGICDSISKIDFVEVHSFAAQPKTPNPVRDPEGFAAEQKRLYSEYGEAYVRFFRDNMPGCGVPARFTVHVVDFPDKAASYEFYGVGYYQPSLHE